MKRLFTVLFLWIWMSTPAMGGWFGPSNYDECILKHMKGVTSDKAVREIRRACRAKFPKKPIKKPKLRDVPKKVLEDITGNVWFKDKAHPEPRYVCINFYAELHNDNAKWTITEVQIRIFDKATKTYEYILSITHVLEELPPFETEVFSFFVKKVPAEWEWDIVEAKGYREPFFSFF